VGLRGAGAVLPAGRDALSLVECVTYRENAPRPAEDLAAGTKPKRQKRHGGLVAVPVPEGPGERSDQGDIEARQRVAFGLGTQA
jgi:hypothetical protein